MRRRIFASSALAFSLLASMTGEADAAQNLRVQVDQRGDFLLIGAPLAQDCANTPGSVLVGTVADCGTNTADSGIDVPWAADSPAAGGALADVSVTVANARSTAQLNIPAGATVTHAFLYWAATLPAPGVDATATLSRQGGFNTSVMAATTFQSTNNSYMSVTDITSIVQTNGSGGYRVSGVDFITPNNLNNSNIFAGWHMVVFYQDPGATQRNLALFDGFDAVANGIPQTVTLNGFLASMGASSAKLGVVTYEGDNTLIGDSLFVNPSTMPNPPAGEALTDALNPANNFFNGSRTSFGVPVTTAGDLPQLSGDAQSMSGIDIDVVDIQTKVQPLDTQMTIHASSTSDVYYLATFVTSLATFKPDFTASTKSAVDLNGGPLLPGDIVEYTVVVTNTGNDTSINTVMTDQIPAGVTYLGGTLQITAGANTGMKSDIMGDDQGEYNGAAKTLTVRLGSSADSVIGGLMAAAESTTIKFQVTVDPNVYGTISNQAIINADGLLGSPNTTTPTDGNGAGGGAPPTDIVVEQCIDDAGCGVQTPYCDTAATPNICVQCITNADCSGAFSTCDVGSHTCICVPSGPEMCDGLDNDCNGQVDEGNPPGGGVPCSTGIPGICNSGLVSCVAGPFQCVPNILPGDQPEICDGIDDDCNGSVDEGYNIGAACSVGVGACQSNGTIICDGMGGAVCDAAPGPPSAEVCGDGIDQDCDGVPDNGCGAGGAGGMGGSAGTGGSSASSSSSGTGGFSGSSSSSGTGGSTGMGGYGGSASLSICRTPADCPIEGPLDSVKCSCSAGPAPRGDGALFTALLSMLAAFGRRKLRGGARVSVGSRAIRRRRSS